MDYSEVYFALYGKDFDPSVALKLIDVDSAVIQKRGDPIPKFSSWRCTSGKLGLDVFNIDQVASDLIDKLGPHRDTILALRRNHELKAVLEVVVTFSSDEARSTPAIGFDETVIEFLQYVGATIDIDTYVS